MRIPNLLYAIAASSGTALSSSTTIKTLPTPSSSPNSTSKIITVGKGAFTFVPDSVTAKPGDEIIFEFWSDGHSVARAQFGFPCMPYEDVTPNVTGFWSGDIFHVSTGSHPKYTITVNETEPIFLYCSAPNSFNPDILELKPGDPIPSESSGLEPITASTTTTGSTAGPIQPDNEHNHETSPLPTGGIAGVAIGSAVVLLLAGSLVYVCGRQGGFEKGYRRHTAADNPEPKAQNSHGNSPRSQPLGPPYSSPAGQWSPYSPVASPRRSQFQPYRPGVSISSPVPSISSQGLLSEQVKYEVPGSQAPAELAADGSPHVSRIS
ncbi:hypothetical protein HD806DRAFT_536648 [Xylariaceae sp. AK1471]|nr:hypothetical protein HD806DRAFT_536648 [Xylariaceae sp. AK1471]